MMNNTITVMEIDKEITPIIKKVYKGFPFQSQNLDDFNGLLFKIGTGIGLVDLVVITTERKCTISRIIMEPLITKDSMHDGVIHSLYCQMVYTGPKEFEGVLVRMRKQMK